jgi:hypothetical protein
MVAGGLSLVWNLTSVSLQSPPSVVEHMPTVDITAAPGNPQQSTPTSHN